MLRRIFTLVAWILVAFWLPATLHCAAETSGWIETAGCCADEALPVADSHCESDHCATLEAGVPREELSALVLCVPALALLEVLRPELRTENDADNGVTPWLAAPPEIGGRWRATERVVAAARAP
ncbi:MAG TPA: hypothetical protein VK178_01515 [Opitutaceae bacterium]|nr:hypothetical protein [Opitutaceae bacterium]